MNTIVNIRGAIDRSERDPNGSAHPSIKWIGMVEVRWEGQEVDCQDSFGSRSAAVLCAETGRRAPLFVHDPSSACGDAMTWGDSILLLRWIGDPAPARVARSVYDHLLEGGPARRQISAHRRID